MTQSRAISWVVIVMVTALFLLANVAQRHIQRVQRCYKLSAVQLQHAEWCSNVLGSSDIER